MIKSIFDESEEQIKREIAGDETQPVAPENQFARTDLPVIEPENFTVIKTEESVLPIAQNENINLSETDSVLEIPDLRAPEFVAETEPVIVAETKTQPDVLFAGNAETKSETQEQPLFVQPNFTPESKADTIRKSGLAYAAGIVLFGSIVFMLLIGWFFDLLVGTSPWGIVGGIVLGAILGFYQFFRLTSQIINNKN